MFLTDTRNLVMLIPTSVFSFPFWGACTDSVDVPDPYEPSAVIMMEDVELEEKYKDLPCFAKYERSPTRLEKAACDAYNNCRDTTKQPPYKCYNDYLLIMAAHWGD